MGWFNYYGLAFMAVIMIPNIIYAIKHKNNAVNAYKNKAVVIAEQIGRYGSFVLMIFNIPYTYFNFWFENALIVYLSVNSGLCLVYLICWLTYRKRKTKTNTVLLALIPSCSFLFCGIVLANIPLIAFAIIFAISHIYISCRYAI